MTKDKVLFELSIVKFEDGNPTKFVVENISRDDIELFEKMLESGYFADDVLLQVAKMED